MQRQPKHQTQFHDIYHGFKYSSIVSNFLFQVYVVSTPLSTLQHRQITRSGGKDSFPPHKIDKKLIIAFFAI
jgi:hypothetical protein